MPRKLETEDLSKTVVCNESDSVIEVAQILRDTKARYLVVLDDSDTVHGIISLSDINNRIVAEEKNPNDLKAGDIMTKDIVSITPDSDLSEAIDTMSKNNLSSIPVMNEKKQLLGSVELTKVMTQLCDFEKKLQENK